MRRSSAATSASVNVRIGRRSFSPLKLGIKLSANVHGRKGHPSRH
jgi:hypothetical protein